MASTSQQETVEQYFEGFRRSDRPSILSLLTDDVHWDLPGFRHLVGKEDFEGEIVNDAFEENPRLTIDRIFEDRNTVIVVGTGEGEQKDGGVFRFAFCDLFTFRGELISRVESYLVPIS
ncbi:MAG: nuclear transport factor 2 family protein [Dehalococcoidia bacterium]